MIDIPPSVEAVRAELLRLSLRQIDQLSTLSGVPPTTIYKIRRGETENPGIETVRKFMPHIAVVLGGVAIDTSAAPAQEAA